MSEIKNNNKKNFPRYGKFQTVILRRVEWGCEGEGRSKGGRCSVNELRSHLIKIVDLLIKCIPYTHRTLIHVILFVSKLIIN